MQTLSSRQKLVAGSLAIAMFATTVSPTFAQPVRAQEPHVNQLLQNNQDRAEEIRSKIETKRQEIQTRVEQMNVQMASKSAELQLRKAEREELRKERLEGVKLQVCQNRFDAIVRHATNAETRANNVLEKMNSIANKVVEFKEDKNIAVEDYEELVTEIEAKRLVVVETIDTAKTNASEFDCESDGPKVQLQQFVGSMDEVRAALKEYRDSIHDLILAVRQANGTQRDGTQEATDSAELNDDESTESAQEAE